MLRWFGLHTRQSQRATLTGYKLEHRMQHILAFIALTLQQRFERK